MVYPDGDVPAEPAATPVDPGRAARTVIDPGRGRQGEPGGLPAWVREGYEIDEDRPLRTSTDGRGEADVYRGRRRRDGLRVIVKHYVAGRAPSARVWEHLRRDRRGVADPYLLRVLETDASGGRAVEVAEFVGRDRPVDLLEVRGEFAQADQVRRLVTQLATALDELHGSDMVHGDVKPSNILVRSTGTGRADAIEPVLIDVGTAVDLRARPDDPRWVCTPAYQPPEWDELGRPSKEADWWALGMTLLELVQGYNPFEGFDSERMQRRFRQRLVDVSGVADPALRQLCRGLLTRDTSRRWGSAEVGRWIQRRPDLPVVEPDETEAARAPAFVQEGYVFEGYQFRNHELLRRVMTREWEAAVAHLFRPGSTNLGDLERWLGLFGETTQEARAVIPTLPTMSGTNNVRLLRLLLAIDLTHTPIYRNESIIPSNITNLAARAQGGVGAAADVLRDLWVFRLLPELARSTRSEDGPGGDGLEEVQQRWVDARRRWFAIMWQQDGTARRLMRQQLRNRSVRATWLLAAQSRAGEREATAMRERYSRDVRRELERTAGLRISVDWFARLAADPDPDCLWVAWSLLPEAQIEADRIRLQRQAQRQADVYKSTMDSVRVWSRRQSTPLALAWAVAGTAAVAAVWILLLVLSDAVGWSGPGSIDTAWLVTVAAVAATLAIESVLAIAIGGGYERMDSIFGASALAVRPFAAWAAANGLLALPVVLGTVGGVLLLAFLAPVAVPAGTALALLVWAVQRYRRWRVQEETRDEQRQSDATARADRFRDEQAQAVGADAGAS